MSREKEKEEKGGEKEGAQFVGSHSGKCSLRVGSTTKPILSNNKLEKVIGNEGKRENARKGGVRGTAEHFLTVGRPSALGRIERGGTQATNKKK